MLVTYSEMFGDIHTVVLHPLLCCVVQSEVLVFSQGLFLLSWIQVSANPDQSHSPICGTSSPKKTPQARCWSSPRGTLSHRLLGIAAWPGESPGIFRTSQLCVTDLWALEADLLPPWLGSYPQMPCQLWHVTMMSIFPKLQQETSPTLSRELIRVSQRSL